MNVVFMGTPEIAATCLQGLLDAGISVTAVYTKPDTPKNRGMKMTMSPVKELALEHIACNLAHRSSLEFGHHLEHHRREHQQFVTNEQDRLEILV